MLDSPPEPQSERQSFEESLGFGPTATVKPVRRARRTAPGLFGLTAFQRLVLSLMLMLAVIILGTMCLLLTGRISTF